MILHKWLLVVQTQISTWSIVSDTPSVHEILQLRRFIEICKLLQQDIEAVEKEQAMQTFKEN